MSDQYACAPFKSAICTIENRQMEMRQWVSYKSMMPSLTKQILLNVKVFNVFTQYMLVGKLGQAGQHTFIQKTIKHLHLSISKRAICTLKWCAGIMIRQIRSDQISLDKSMLHSLMVKHSCVINKNLLKPFLIQSIKIQILE